MEKVVDLSELKILGVGGVEHAENALYVDFVFGGHGGFNELCMR